MARVVVALDESPLAERSLPWAALVARAEGLPVHLITVYRSDLDFWESADLDPAGPIRLAQETAPAYLATVATLPPLAGVKVSTQVRSGDVAREIAAAATEAETRMVVITTRGRGGFREWGYGSVAGKLVRTVQVPLLVVPPRGVEPSLEGVVVTLDGSPAAEQALQPAKRLASAAGVRLHLLRVVDPDVDWGIDESDYETFMDHETARAERYLHALGKPDDFPVVLRGKPDETILAYARGNRCQVIAMATHGRSGAIRLELGSTADAVVRSADRPVLLVRVPEER